MADYPRIRGIYSITNIVNRKVYVGSSADIYARVTNHRKYLDQGRHINKRLQADWTRYGRRGFVFAIIEEAAVDDVALAQIEGRHLNAAHASGRCYNRFGQNPWCGRNPQQPREPPRPLPSARCTRILKRGQCRVVVYGTETPALCHWHDHPEILDLALRALELEHDPDTRDH